MKETNSIIIAIIVIPIITIVIFLSISCKTATILDYHTESFQNFLKEYSFNNHEFDVYRKNDNLFFAHIIRYDYETYELYLSIYSLENIKYTDCIQKVELMNAEGLLLFSKENIIGDKLTQPTKNDLFVTYITLIDNIPKQKLLKGNYIVNIYLENTVFTYQFYPDERRYIIAISQ